MGLSWRIVNINCKIEYSREKSIVMHLVDIKKNVLYFEYYFELLKPGKMHQLLLIIVIDTPELYQ